MCVNIVLGLFFNNGMPDPASTDFVSHMARVLCEYTTMSRAGTIRPLNRRESGCAVCTHCVTPHECP